MRRVSAWTTCRHPVKCEFGLNHDFFIFGGGGGVGRNCEIKMGGTTVTHYFFEAKVFIIKNVGTIPRHPLDPGGPPIKQKTLAKTPLFKTLWGIPKVYQKSEMKYVCIMYETSISFCFRTPLQLVALIYIL